MQIDIDNKIYKKSTRKKPVNQIWPVIWRVLLLCAIIDGGIYFYFHSIQKITVTEGIRRIRFAIHGNEDQRIEIIHKTNIYIPQKNSSTYSEEAKNNRKSMYVGGKDIETNLEKYSPLTSSKTTEIVNKIYCWEDKNGVKHFSNIGYPSDGYFKVVKFE